MNLITWAILGLFIIIILGIVSNTGQTSIRNIQGQLFIANCPSPIFEGVATDLDISGFAVVYNVTHSKDINGNTTTNDQDKVGTKFECTMVNGLFQVSTTTRQYGATLFSVIPYGWVGYISDWLSLQLSKMQAMFTLLAYFVTPANFDIMGFTLNDVGGMGLVVIIALYAFAYLPILIFAYKTLSPFVGGL